MNWQNGKFKNVFYLMSTTFIANHIVGAQGLAPLHHVENPFVPNDTVGAHSRAPLHNSANPFIANCIIKFFRFQHG
jgi:hypothetical protein